MDTNELYIVPGLGVREDEQAVKQLEKYYPHHKVILVPGCQDLVREGGALNCITWNILTNEPKLRQEEA